MTINDDPAQHSLIVRFEPPANSAGRGCLPAACEIGDAAGMKVMDARWGYSDDDWWPRVPIKKEQQALIDAAQALADADAPVPSSVVIQLIEIIEKQSGSKLPSPVKTIFLA
jgi:hypothetical protein